MDNDKCCNVMRDLLSTATRTSEIGLTVALASTQAKTTSTQNNTRANSVRWIVDLLQLHGSHHYFYPAASMWFDCSPTTTRKLLKDTHPVPTSQWHSSHDISSLTACIATEVSSCKHHLS